MGDATTRKYHVAHQGRKFGPLSLVELSSRRLTSDMLVWCEGMPEWVPISEIPELRGYVHHAVAAHTVAPPTAASAMARTSAAAFTGSAVTSAVGPPISFTPPQPPSAPTGGGRRIRFLGITTIILSCVGLLCCPILFLSVVALEHTELEQAEAAGEGATLGTAGWSMVRNLIISGSILVSMPMLAAGIGLLYHRRWAAITALFTSITCILLNLGASVIECLGGFAFLQNAGDFSEPEVGGAVAGMVAGMVAYLAGIIWHAVMVFLLNSKAVRQNLR